MNNADTSESLSDKRFEHCEGDGTKVWYPEEDIKKFIKKRDKLILSLLKSWEIDEDVIKSFIVQKDKLAGGKLV